MPSTIQPNAPLATLINVFTVRPERQQELVDLLNQASEEVMITLPGFVSASIHASTDGTKVVNYAQWSDAEAFQAMLANPVAQPHMNAAAEVAESFDPHLYTVEAVHSVDEI
ncbi:antibiotic biosynthesis monooxygenase [Saccharopolyspora gloriosae]|uniref:antibiotic biosynthesis monooxygenase family protein n=1 Tax=Saccharopolyspora gloriosae TaxID=455344 RepID=UPI001FB7D383|nr:antibiotic biosynthesis monooxygenase family protein [Saccharopolyspora gloriosae]